LRLMRKGRAIRARYKLDGLIGAILHAAIAAIAVRQVDHCGRRTPEGWQPWQEGEQGRTAEQQRPQAPGAPFLRQRIERQEEPVEADPVWHPGEVGRPLAGRGLP